MSPKGAVGNKEAAVGETDRIRSMREFDERFLPRAVRRDQLERESPTEIGDEIAERAVDVLRQRLSSG